MFDALKNLGNLGALMKQGAADAGPDEADAGGAGRRSTSPPKPAAGWSHATVNGRMELVKLKIDKSRIDANDTELLEDVIVAAVNAAQARAAEMMKAEMSKAAGEMGLPPGMLGGGE